MRRDLRELLRSLRAYARQTAKFPDHTGLGDTIFIVAAPAYDAAPGYEDLRFVLFEEQEKRVPRIRSFGWRREFVGRTVLTHNLERLHWSNRGAWLNAWDVESLTEQFYKDYAEVFASVLSQVQGAPDDKTRHNWTQLLFNRLLFLAFIQRMEWLQVPGGSKDGYLFDLFRAPRGEFRTFYGMLRATFAELDTEKHALGKDKHAATIGKVPYLNGGLFDREDPLDRPDITVPDEAFQVILGEPHGLFARYNFTVTESTPLDQEVAVDPEMLGKIFERLIIQAERHGSGTYYTPRPIVAFMVDEAIKGYLVEGGLSAVKASLLVDQEQLRDTRTGVHIDADEVAALRKRLLAMRAVDPACGSGAYLLGLLQKLFGLVDLLNLGDSKPRDLYHTKLRLLQHCIYGVDLNETAIRIARLRLWLSLVVENKGEHPDPLPNFDFLIMQGDALASPLSLDDRTLGYPHDEIREYTRMKRLFFHPDVNEARPTREAMKAQRAKIAAAFDDQLANSALRSRSSMPFDWEVDFAEVFDPRESEHTDGGRQNQGLEGGRNGQGELAAQARRTPGFDIVVANPPYVNSGELLRNAGKAYKEALVKEYPSTATGTADLLVYFMERALGLLRPGGQFAFITSNKWLKAAYGQNLRKQMAKRAQVHHLIDFRDLPVFQGTIAYPLITIATKRVDEDKSEVTTRFTPVTSLNPPYPDLPTIIQEWGGDLPSGSLGREGTWRLETGEAAQRLASMRQRGIPLGEYVKGRIYYGIKTGLNEVKIGSDGKMYGKSVPPGVRVVRKEGVFVIDGAKRAELIAEDPKSAEIIKPLATGRDIKRWFVEDNDRWLILTKIGTDMDRYPAVMKHLSRFEALLRPRADQGNHWWELRACAYYDAFDEAKIAYPDMFQDSRFAVATGGTLFPNTAYIIPVSETFLVGILNSESFFAQLSGLLNTNLAQTARGFTDRLRSALIPLVSEKDRKAIGNLVSDILDAKAADPKADVSVLEAEINARVEFLYFHRGERGSREVTYEDGTTETIPVPDTYDEWLALKEAEAGTAIEEVRKLISSTEHQQLEFKSSVIWNVHRDQHDLVMRDEVLKEICAFLNAGGGTILCGVREKADGTGELVGIAKDIKHAGNIEKLCRVLTNALGDLLKPDPAELIKVETVQVDQHTVLRIQVTADASQMYQSPAIPKGQTTGGKPTTHVRVNGEARALDGQALINWWQRRQKGEA